MSNYNINGNDILVKKIIDNSKNDYFHYCADHPNSIIPAFEKELHDLGFEFEILDQIKGFMPKYKKQILPIAVDYYQRANSEEKSFFMSFFHFKGFEEVVPILLDDFFRNTLMLIDGKYRTGCIRFHRRNTLAIT